MNSSTFFSYKGGAGRSTTCFNTVPFIAEALGATKDKPVILVDMDIDSAGMTYLLGLDEYYHEAATFSVQSLLLNENRQLLTNSRFGSSFKSHPLSQLLVPVGEKFGLTDNESVLFLGVNDKTPFDRVRLANLVSSIIQQFKIVCATNGAAHMIFDSSTGDQPTARASIENSSHVVVCMRPTTQFRKGTTNYLKNHRGLLANRKVIPLPTVVPVDRTINNISMLDENVAYWDVTARSLARVERLRLDIDLLSKANYGIPEIVRFKWKEDVVYKLGREGELFEDEVQGFERYKLLAQLNVR